MSEAYTSMLSIPKHIDNLQENRVLNRMGCHATKMEKVRSQVDVGTKNNIIGLSVSKSFLKMQKSEKRHRGQWCVSKPGQVHTS